MLHDAIEQSTGYLDESEYGVVDYLGVVHRPACGVAVL
jgi:hypothetical protein